MVPTIVTDSSGRFWTEGLRPPQEQLAREKVEDLIQRTDARASDGPSIDEIVGEVAALWVGDEFASHADRLGVPVPPVDSPTTHRGEGGRYWVAPVRHVWHVHDLWVTQAVRRAVKSENVALARHALMAAPDRIESRAARYSTLRGPEREREVAWWARLANDAGARGSPATMESQLRRVAADIERQPIAPVIGFAAPAKGGDKEIAAKVAEAEGYERFSFGDWLKDRAIQERLHPDRLVLQKLGQEMIENFGELAFCLYVLDRSLTQLNKAPSVIEGIRHRMVFESLKTLFGDDRFRLTYVDRSPEERRTLLKQREHLSDAEVDLVLADPTERDLPDLRQHADLKLTADDNAGPLAREVIQEYALSHH